MKILKLFIIIGLFIFNVTPVWSEDSQGGNAEQNFFYKETVKLDEYKREDTLVGIRADNDAEPGSILNMWAKKDKSSEKKSDLEKVAPEKITHEVVKFSPELATRALVKGDFISASMQDSRDGELVKTFEALENLDPWVNEAVFSAQHVAAGRLKNAYATYRMMFRSQLNDADYGAKQAFAALNSCIFKTIEEKNTTWIVALYSCLGDKASSEISTGSEKKMEASVKNVKESVKGEDKDGPWSAKFHALNNDAQYMSYAKQVSSDGESIDPNKDITLNGLLFCYKDADGQDAGGVDNLTMAKSWYEWFGDYKITINDTGDDTGNPTAGNKDGSQYIKITEKYIKPKYPFKKIYEKILAKRYGDFGIVMDYYCREIHKNEQTSDKELKVWKSEDEIFSGESKKMKQNVKNAVWNISTPERPFQETIVRFFINFYERYADPSVNSEGTSAGSSETDKYCNVWKRMSEMKNKDKVDLNYIIQDTSSGGKKITPGAAAIVYTYRYAQYLTVSQLIHSIQAARLYAGERSGSITSVGGDLFKMSEDLIERAIGFNLDELNEKLTDNAKEWSNMLENAAKAVAEVSGEAAQ